MDEKLFVIGANKTGTESMKAFLQQLGYTFAPQIKGEELLHQVYQGKYKQLHKLIAQANCFKDIPYNVLNVYQELETVYPQAKFILTIRDQDSWYNSLTSFHRKFNIYDALSMIYSQYVYPSFFWHYYHFCLNYDPEKSREDNKDNIIQAYNDYNQRVITYFADKPNKLLIVNLTESDKAEKICQFLDTDYIGQEYPHHNKTKQ